MNAERLLAQFERISEAPDAVARLRRFILDLAVRGKLVEPPRSWLECSLGDVGDWGSGGTPLRTKPEYYGGDIPWLVIGDLNDGLVTASATTITEEGLSNSSAKVVDEGTLLIAMYGSIGKLGVAGMRCATNQAIAFCRPYSDMVTGDYLFVLLKSLRNELLLQGQGVAQQNISQKILKAHPVELPPLAEQHRIVAKVDELMALCDQLEAARQQREQGRERLVAAVLQRLNQPAEDPASFRQDATFAVQVLPSLTSAPAQIKQLRQTILNLAARGKLVEQDPEDIDERNFFRLAPQAKTCDLIPRSWLYVPLAELLSEDTRNGYSRKPDDAVDGVPILRISAGTARPDGLVAEEEFKLISGIDDKLLGQYEVRTGDLLACRFNGNKAYVGRLSLFSGYLHQRFIYPDKLIRIRLAEELAEPSFLRWISGADLVREEVETKCATTVGNWGISAGKLKTCLVPLPPLAEQHRIVAKVDELMALCDQLEQQLSQADQQRRRLLEAVLAEALGGRLSTEQEESHAAIA